MSSVIVMVVSTIISVLGFITIFFCVKELIRVTKTYLHEKKVNDGYGEKEGIIEEIEDCKEHKGYKNVWISKDVGSNYFRRRLIVQDEKAEKLKVGMYIKMEGKYIKIKME